MNKSDTEPLRPITEVIGQPNKYHPFIDVDGNGSIIITALKLIPQNEKSLIFTNISGMFNDKGFAEPDDASVITYDFNEAKIFVGNLAGYADMAINDIERLYRNEIDSLGLRNLPNLTYDDLSDEPIDYNVAAIQWQRSDFDKIIAYITLTYKNNVSH
jgi:hypothetical protein